jgi:hypothetical protein
MLLLFTAHQLKCKQWKIAWFYIQNYSLWFQQVNAIFEQITFLTQSQTFSVGGDDSKKVVDR